MKVSAPLLLVLLGLGACTGTKDTGTPPAQVSGPTLEHEPPEGDLRGGDSVTIEVTATDPDGVSEVIVYHRTAESTYWDNTPMEQAEGDLWSAEIGPLYVPGLEYYFEARDGGSSLSSLPEEGQADPLLLDVQAGAVALPWTEDFELEEDETSLFTMDWWAPSEGFDAYTWEVSASQSMSGVSSALHVRSPSEVGVVRDWLISPALDFSTLDQIMVTWWERGNNITTAGAHGLYISMGSRDIENGDFVPVVDALSLPPEDQWGRSQAVDLSEYAGATEVYLAWVYEGEEADEWAIDDIVVGELKPDLEASVLWLPDPVHPGETVDLTVIFDNSTPAGTTGLSATLSLPDGGATITDETVDVPDLDPEGTTQATFELTLDPDLHDNQYLPLHVTLTDGTDSWEFDLQMTVGLPSEAALQLTLDALGTVNVIFGIGDPDDPLMAVVGHSGILDAGTQTVTADITDLYELLPPGPGPDRWFAEVTTSVSGTIDAFEITYGGENSSAAVLPALGGTQIVYLPAPPDPQLVSSVPSQSQPGTSGVPVVLQLTNAGAITAGPVWATLSSLSPDVVVNNGTDLVLSADPWEGGETLTLTGPTLDIGTGHNRSRPAELELLLDDGVESWTLPIEVEVPWPVLQVHGMEIDDGTSGNAVLDAGEAADITIDLSNIGDLPTFSRLTGTLSIASTSTASATVTSADASFFTISPGSTRDDEFGLTVTSGSAGDTLDLVLDLTDGTASYTVTTQIVLGVPPWQALSVAGDTIGDSNGYAVDIVNAWYRVSGTQVEILIESDTPVGSSPFVEAWGVASSGAWAYYRWVVQPAASKLYGYSIEAGAFFPIGEITTTTPTPTTILMSFDSTDMEITLDQFDIGFAAGWCGSPTYFCDHFPNGWGWPYGGAGFDTSDWFQVRW